MSLQDREFLQATNARYYGSLGYDTEGELKEMLAHGFPSPADWLHARTKTAAELEREYKAGSTTAGFLYADRLIDEASKLTGTREQHPSLYQKGRGGDIGTEA